MDIKIFDWADGSKQPRFLLITIKKMTECMLGLRVGCMTVNGRT